MFNSKSLLSTVRSLNSETTEEESSNQSNVTAIAEMNAAITDLDAWRKQRETNSSDLLRQMILSEEQEENNNNNTTYSLHTLAATTSTSSTFLTDHKVTNTPDNNNRNNNNDDDDDPVSRAYEKRLQSELHALQMKRKQMEEVAKSPQAPTIHRLPTELLISAAQLKTLTEDTRLHVGNKSVEMLKNENVRMHMENEVRELEGGIHDDAVMKVLAAEGSEFENMAGLTNVLETFELQMADLLLKMDVVDESAERRTTPRITTKESVTVDVTLTDTESVGQTSDEL